MSLQDIMNPQEPAPAPVEQQRFDDVLKEQKMPLRSWRKKYRKMKLKFDRVMDESNALFKDCKKLEVLAKRLQEENEYVYAPALPSLIIRVIMLIKIGA